jgi:hypothetical protein
MKARRRGDEAGPARCGIDRSEVHGLNPKIANMLPYNHFYLAAFGVKPEIDPRSRANRIVSGLKRDG